MAGVRGASPRLRGGLDRVADADARFLEELLGAELGFGDDLDGARIPGPASVVSRALARSGWSR